MSAPVPVAPTLPVEPPDPRGPGGLLALLGGAEIPLPLQEVRVRAAIAGGCCRTVIEQRFENGHDQPIEAVHLFPLPEDGAVVEVELRAGEITVRAECRERQEAEEAFASARRAGHRAALLTAERADVHTLRVTNLPPGEVVRVRIVVVERLSAADGRTLWRFPTVIAPRYLPGTPSGHQGPGHLPDTDRVPDASRLQPPLRLEGGTALDLEVHVAGPVRRVESSLHAVCLDLEDGGVRLAPSGRATLDRDLVLAFTTGEPDRAALRAWTDGAHTLVAVEPPHATLAPPLPRDAVFVVDISGSMGGAKITAARLALKTALHGLLPGDRFRLIAFDDRLEVFRKDFLAYDGAALAAADRWIDALGARGGTEMLPAIREALAGETPEGRVRTVLFVTDGQAWNEEELVAAVAHRRRAARFFTMGIDTAVNGALLKRLARVGGGTCELVTPREDVEAAVARLEARFGSPLVEGIRLEGAARQEDEVLFAGRPVVLLCEGAPDEVTVEGRSAEGAITLRATPARIDFPLGALWARDRVAWLEDRLTLRPFEEEAIRPEIVKIALRHGIASRFTAFVAVERSRTVDGEPVEVVQPAELPAEWSEDFLAQPLLAQPTGAPAPLREAEAPMDALACAAPQPRKRSGPLRSAAEAVGGAMGAFRSRGSSYASPADAPAPPPPTDPAGELARSQEADGSFGGDVGRTAAALVLLVLLGHTRHGGLRRRTVQKAASWLAGRSEPLARLALDVLARAEAGEPVAADASWSPLYGAGEEGRRLEEAAG